PFAFIQGVGRPDLTAKFHLIELPLYLLVLWLLTKQWGIAGSAAAGTRRAVFDATALFAMSAWLDQRLSLPLKQYAPVLVVALIGLALGCLIDDLAAKAALVGATIIGFSILAWRTISSDRQVLAQSL